MRDLFRANLTHAPRNLMIALQGLQLTDQMNLYTYYGMTLASQTLAYPFMLVQRRLETLTQCRRLQGAGLPHVADAPDSFLKMCRETWAKEGFRGFYRGYSCYMVAIMFWMSALPFASQFFNNFDPS